jgi:hypothetical protein
MNQNPTIPEQTITLDGPDWQIATDPDNTGRDERWFDWMQLGGSAALSERWTVFELAEKTDIEPMGDQLLELPKTLTVGGAATQKHEFAVESGHLDLRVLPGWESQGKTAYVYIPFSAQEDGLHTLGIGADWWHKAWIDGEVTSDTLATGNGKNPITMLDHLRSVQLCKGAHLLVVRFISGSGGAVLTVGGSFILQRRAEVKPTKVPSVIQNIFPGYHGVAWYFRTFLLHCCGGVYPLLRDLINAGLDAINPVQFTCAGMEVARLKREFGQDLTFWGGDCDTRDVLPHGTPEQVFAHVRGQIKLLAPHGGFVFQQVHNIMNDAPAENIIAMFAAVRAS